MLLTITYAGDNATELGYLLYKNPYRPQVFELNQCKAYIFYPVISDKRTTAALLLDIDPIDLAKGKAGSSGGGLFDYVNDRPYVSSSFMSTAISRVFGTAMSGRADSRQALSDSPLDLTAILTMLPCKGEHEKLNSVFEPLGYTVSYETFVTDENFPSWGDSKYVNLTISGKVRLRDLLKHLYVLIPVFDRQKHYWVGADEVEKLLKHGEDWLPDHPEKAFITGRYLNRRRSLVNMAFAQLISADGSDDAEMTGAIDGDDTTGTDDTTAARDTTGTDDTTAARDTSGTDDTTAAIDTTGTDDTTAAIDTTGTDDTTDTIDSIATDDAALAIDTTGTDDTTDTTESTNSYDTVDIYGLESVKKAIEKVMEKTAVKADEPQDKKLNLNAQRLGSVVAALKSCGAKRVIDIGCGEGHLLELLVKESRFTKITGVDVSHVALDRANKRLKLERAGDFMRERVQLFQGSLVYKDERFDGYDAACVIEVIEHLDIPRLTAFERVLFEFARPPVVVLTTPNREYNEKYENLSALALRHSDHRFEYTRAEFRSWAAGVAQKYGYSIAFSEIGDSDANLGAPTQMGVFSLCV